MSAEITLPPVATAYLNAKVASGEYASVTEALLDALLLLQERDAARARLRAALKEGEDSGEGPTAEESLAELDALIEAMPEDA